MLFYLTILVMSFSITIFTFIKFLKTFTKKKIKIKNNMPKFYFLLFLFFVLCFLILRISLLLFFGSEFNVLYTSKFNGSKEYYLILVIISSISLLVTLSVLSLILSGLSFRNVQKFEYIISIAFILLWFYLFFTSELIEANYNLELGWTYSLDSSVNILNILMFLWGIYFLINIILLCYNTQNEKLKNRFKIFMIGSFVFVIGLGVIYMIINRIFGNKGIESFIFAISSLIYYLSFRN